LNLDPFYFPLAHGKFPDWAQKWFLENFSTFSSNLVAKPDIIYQESKNVDIGGQYVLVVGGGPSTNLLIRGEYDLYDAVWSINKFYRHRILEKIKVDVVSVGAGVDLLNEQFHNYIHKFKPVLMFEVHPAWHTQKRLINSFYEKSKKICSHTRIYGQIGGGVRLINLAASLGASQIDFIGLDGPEAILEGRHAFEPGKKALPSFCQPHTASRIHQEHYDFFWKYIQELYPNCKLNSLDKHNKYHRLCYG
jgi:hypothetical protein